MKKIAVFIIAALWPAVCALAADEKIDPATFICAELVTASLDGQPPLYEGLQLDGYLAAKQKHVVADADAMAPLLVAVSDSCAAKPAEKALDHWKELRKLYPFQDDGQWRVDRATCGDYNANPDDGSGFVIWADAWQRGTSGSSASVFVNQATLDHFLEECRANPQKLLVEVIRENAK